MRTHTKKITLTHSSFSLNPEKRWHVARWKLNRNLYNLCVHVIKENARHFADKKKKSTQLKNIRKSLLKKKEGRQKKINNKFNEWVEATKKVYECKTVNWSNKININENYDRITHSK